MESPAAARVSYILCQTKNGMWVTGESTLYLCLCRCLPYAKAWHTPPKTHRPHGMRLARFKALHFPASPLVVSSGAYNLWPVPNSSAAVVPPDQPAAALLGFYFCSRDSLRCWRVSRGRSPPWRHYACPLSPAQRHSWEPNGSVCIKGEVSWQSAHHCLRCKRSSTHE